MKLSQRQSDRLETLEIALLRAVIETGIQPEAHEVPLLLAEMTQRLNRVHFASAESFHSAAFDTALNLLGEDGSLS